VSQPVGGGDDGLGAAAEPQQPVGDPGFDALGVELADGPFHIETCRRRLEYVMGIDVTFATSRGALQERVANPEAVY